MIGRGPAGYAVRTIVLGFTTMRYRASWITVVLTLMCAGAAVSAQQAPNWLPIRNGRETVRVPVAEIEWVDAAGDYLCIHASGHTHILRATMREMENLLDPRLFQRVHRSTIVNLDLVRQVKPHTNGECFLVLDSGAQVKVSRSYRDVVARFVH